MIVTSFFTSVGLFAQSTCGGGNFLFFPTWYKYLPTNPPDCTPTIANINDVWLIVAAVIEIMLRIAAIIAVVYVIWGGFDYLTSQGESEKVNKGRSTLISALVGLAIAMSATALINFVAGRVH